MIQNLVLDGCSQSRPCLTKDRRCGATVAARGRGGDHASVRPDMVETLLRGMAQDGRDQEGAAVEEMLRLSRLDPPSSGARRMGTRRSSI